MLCAFAGAKAYDAAPSNAFNKTQQHDQQRGHSESCMGGGTPALQFSVSSHW